MEDLQKSYKYARHLSIQLRENIERLDLVQSNGQKSDQLQSIKSQLAQLQTRFDRFNECVLDTRSQRAIGLPIHLQKTPLQSQFRNEQYNFAQYINLQYINFVLLWPLQKYSLDLESSFRMSRVRDSGIQQGAWKRKVEQISEECTSLRQAVQSYDVREQRAAIEARDRQELLASGFQSSSQNSNMAQQLDMEAQMKSGFANSRAVLAEAIETGTNILTGMAGTKDTLKASQRKALDVLNSIGLSSSLLRIIERRHKMDSIILYAGMVVVTVIVLVVWWYFKR